MLKSLLAATFVAAACASAPAGAQDARSLSVVSADLNLAGAAGRAALDRRVRQAVRAVCALNTPGSLRAMMEERRCAAAAQAAATGQIAAATNTKPFQRLSQR